MNVRRLGLRHTGLGLAVFYQTEAGGRFILSEFRAEDDALPMQFRRWFHALSISRSRALKAFKWINVGASDPRYTGMAKIAEVCRG